MMMSYPLLGAHSLRARFGFPKNGYAGKSKLQRIG